MECFSKNTFPFLTLSWPSNIFDSLHRTGSCLVPGCQSRSTVTGTLIKDVTADKPKERKRKVFRRNSSNKHRFINQRLLPRETHKQESFKVVWKPKRAWFFRRKRAQVSKQSDCHAGASGGYFERLLGWEFHYLK